MAEDKVRELLKNEIEPPLTKEQRREVDRIVNEAEAKLKEQGRL